MTEKKSCMQEPTHDMGSVSNDDHVILRCLMISVFT